MRRAQRLCAVPTRLGRRGAPTFRAIRRRLASRMQIVFVEMISARAVHLPVTHGPLAVEAVISTPPSLQMPMVWLVVTLLLAAGRYCAAKFIVVLGTLWSNLLIQHLPPAWQRAVLRWQCIRLRWMELLRMFRPVGGKTVSK